MFFHITIYDPVYFENYIYDLKEIFYYLFVDSKRFPKIISNVIRHYHTILATPFLTLFTHQHYF